MSVIRAFVAIELSEEIQSQLEEIIAELKRRLGDVPVRWVPVKNIHLTLKFLGDVSVANIDMLKEILKALASNHSKFSISVGGIGSYPKPQQPRVIWVGVEAPPELISVQRNIETEAARLGYAREHRAFSPHLTLGRVSRSASAKEVRAIAEVLEGYKLGFIGVTRVNEIHLFRSDLLPSGAVYQRLYSATFGA